MYLFVSLVKRKLLLHFNVVSGMLGFIAGSEISPSLTLNSHRQSFFCYLNKLFVSL